MSTLRLYIGFGVILVVAFVVAYLTASQNVQHSYSEMKILSGALGGSLMFFIGSWVLIMNLNKRLEKLEETLSKK